MENQKGGLEKSGEGGWEGKAEPGNAAVKMCEPRYIVGLLSLELPAVLFVIFHAPAPNPLCFALAESAWINAMAVSWSLLSVFEI